MSGPAGGPHDGAGGGAFGPRIEADGSVTFSLWAPSAREVALALEDAGAVIEMRNAGGGWFRVNTARARRGSLYRFRIDGESAVPDPASRFQPRGVHGPSEVVEPGDGGWSDGAWRGRPWHETVLYELHVGTFTDAGTFRAVMERLDHLAGVGVTAVELMPVAAFAGARGWGYDGVYPFAPAAAYGRPEDLRALVEAAHERGLMVFLDVVYNHFGPEGNYLHGYAGAFFTERHHTPWGAAINFDGQDAGPVRRFFIDNALHWLETYRMDGLRLDAVHAILDDSPVHVLEELADAVTAGPGASRHVHLVLENDANESRWLRAGPGPARYTAQWNDDFHHAAHVLLTGEQGGYYRDYADRPAWWLARCLGEGFAYQGEPSLHRDGHARGAGTAGLAPHAFVNFLQNHDQVGNRAFGERLGELAGQETVRAATAVLLLAPQPPLLFMGQEWGTTRRFPFFCDFGPDLADAVRDGRRREFASFPQFRDPRNLARIPDPNDPDTFAQAVLDWSEADAGPHAALLALHRELLDARRRHVVPRLPRLQPLPGRWLAHRGAVVAGWEDADGGALHLVANLSAEAVTLPLAPLVPPQARALYTLAVADGGRELEGNLPPWSVVLAGSDPADEPAEAAGGR